MKKLHSLSVRFILILLLFATSLFLTNPPGAYAQLIEPEVRAVDEPVTPLGEGYNNRIGASFFINNFGFGLSGIYARAIGPYTELTFSAGISGIRDPSAQKFINFFSGRQVYPNRYKRALGFPLTVGIEQRIFPRVIADNFRFFISVAGGPAFAFTYPYFDDANGNGYRDRVLLVDPVLEAVVAAQFTERINDFFTGWGDGEGHWGTTGNISIGVDLGRNFGSQVTFEIGYFFYYYPEGLQVMEPTRKDLTLGDVIPGYLPTQDDPNVYITAGQEPFFDAQEFFGTPQIKFTYSGWW